MLSANVDFIDIDPVQWGKLNEVIGLFTEKWLTCYVLYDRSKIINIYLGADQKEIELGKSSREPAAIAEAVFQNHPEINRVETYELSALVNYCKDISFESDQLDSDVYFGICKERRLRLPGINSFQRDRQLKGFNLFDFLPFLERNNPMDYYFAIGIYHADELFFSLFLDIREGKIKLVSTFEHFQTLQIPIPLFSEHPVFTEQLLKTAGKGEIIFLTYDVLKELAEASQPGTVFTNAAQRRRILINPNSLGLLEKFLSGYKRLPTLISNQHRV
jgi:hypothetical protein